MNDVYDLIDDEKTANKLLFLKTKGTTK